MLRFSLRRAKIYKPGKGPKRPESALTPQSESENSAQNEIQNIEKDEMNKLVSKIKNKNKDGEYLPADPHVMDKVYDTTTWEGDFLERMKVVDSKRTIREQTVYDNSSWLDRKKFRYNEIKQAGVFDDENFIAWKDMNKWLNFLIGGSSVVLLSYLTYLYYKHYNNRRLYEYYNSEYDPLKQPTENLVNLINEKVVKKLGYDPEQTNLRFKYIDPANDSVQDKLEVSVFHNPETNGLDIYVPHFYEHDCSLGYFLENSDKYFTFFEDKINTELWEKDIPAKHLLEKVIALSLPSNNEICYNVAYAIVKKYGYKTKEFNKKDGNKEIFDKYTDKEKRTGFPIWFLQDDGHFRSCWKLFFFALGCLIIKRIPTTIGKLPPTTEIRQKHLGVMKFETRLYKTAQRFLLLLGLGYLTTPTLPLLAVKNQEFELEKYLMKLDPYFATGLYEKLKKEQSSVKLVYELEGYETMAQFVDEKGNDRLTSHPITDRQIKRFLVNKMLRSEKLKLVENRIIDDWDLPLPTIRDRFSDEDELSWA